MLFSSPLFLFLFLPVVLALYFATPRAGRNAVLLMMSIIFYAWGERAFALVMIASIACNFVLGLFVARTRKTRTGRLMLALAIILNLGLLIAFKYAGFIAANVNHVLVSTGVAPIPVPQLHLPIGISFFTFHSLSYVIDIHRGDAEVQRNPIDLALYIALFPQLIAGPILRYHHIDRQIRHRTITIGDFAIGAQRFVIGLAKKVLVANTLAVPVDKIWALPAIELSSSLAWLATVCYTLQIYYDFSGYSDMAIGLGRMFGFHFQENFNYPYISQSIREFWRRWHISLSTWFRDYLYLPLGGNRHGVGRTYANLLIVFLLCGLWHGATWCFVIWGLFHGAFLVLERLRLMRWLETSPAFVRHTYTLLAVMTGWVLFRSETLPQALAHLRAMAGVGAHGLVAGSALRFLDPITIAALVAGVLFSAPVLRRLRDEIAPRLERASSGVVLVPLIRLTTVAVLFTASAIQLAAGTYNPFIYFRF